MLDLREQARQHRIPVTVAPGLRAAAIQTWRGRMINEHASARVFEGLAEQLEAAGVSPERVAKCRAFADEERLHGVLCGAVVESLGGEARAAMPPLPAYPRHAAVAPLEGALRNLLSISCLSETIAVSLIGAERLEMPEGPLREVLTQIYADECGHANFGWRLVRELVAGASPALRARLGDWLVVAFAHLEVHELEHLPLGSQPPPEGAAVGLCSGSDARVLFYATVEQVIVPNLEALGLPARQAWQQRGTARAHVHSNAEAVRERAAG